MSFKSSGIFAIKQRFVAIAFSLLISVAMAMGSFWYWSVPQRNVILVTFDTTRADHLGVYGYQQGLTATFDEFAKSGVIFDRAYAPTPITLPSHATMLTGLYPPEHGLRVNGEGCLAENVPLLSEILKRQGYDTAAFIAAFVLDSSFGLARGFDKYDDDLSKAMWATKTNDPRRTGNDIMDSAINWLRQRTGKPFFCWVHFYDAHGPYDARVTEFGNRFEANPYDAGIAAEIQAFNRLASFINERKIEKNTLVIAAADHGEGLDEHMENEHSMLVYNTTLHVPLIFVGRGVCKPGVRVAQPVSLVDIMPTVLDILRIPIPAKVSGRSLRQALQGRVLSSRPCYAEAETPFAVNRWCPLKAVISDQWKFIQTNKPELYNLQEDPGELNNVADSNAEISVEMRNTLELMFHSFEQSLATKVKLTERGKPSLEALGYVAGTDLSKDSDSQSTEGLPDIKEMLPYLAKYEKARVLGLRAMHAEGVILLQEVVHERRDYAEAFLLLGHFLSKLSRFDEAVDAYHSVLDLRPSASDAKLNIARCLSNLRKLDEAESAFRDLLKDFPDHVIAHFQLAGTLVAAKKYDDAIKEYKETIRLDPNFSSPNVQLGQLLVKLDKSAEAVPWLERAMTLNPQNAPVSATLLNVLVKLGETGKALSHATKFAEMNPASFEAHYNLGSLLVTNKRIREGIEELRQAQSLRPDDARPSQLIQKSANASNHQ
jgi:arylsulfatase A-like enzyme/tetratricopeptide (TPR) repeat protein